MTCGMTSASCVARDSMHLGLMLCSRIHARERFCASLSRAIPDVIISFHDFVAYPPSAKSRTYLPSALQIFNAQRPSLWPGMFTITRLPSPSTSYERPTGPSLPFQSKVLILVPSHQHFWKRILVWKSCFYAPFISALETRIFFASATSFSPLAWSQSK